MGFIRKNYLNLLFSIGIIFNFYLFFSIKNTEFEFKNSYSQGECIPVFEKNSSQNNFSYPVTPTIVNQMFPCEKGDKGDRGDHGEKGKPGHNGRDGIDGAAGPRGEKGDEGDKGDKGDTGDTGATGPIGPSGPTGSIGPIGPSGPAGTTQLTYGSFYDTTNQTNPVANVVRTVNYNSTAESDGVSILDGTKIKISKTGVYNIQFSIQVYKDDAGSDTIDFWFVKNGNNIPDTNTRLTLVDRNFYSVAAWNYVTSANAGDELELKWFSADTSASLLTFGPFSSPSRPRIPSVILTVTQIK